MINYETSNRAALRNHLRNIKKVQKIASTTLSMKLGREASYLNTLADKYRLKNRGDIPDKYFEKLMFDIEKIVNPEYSNRYRIESVRDLLNVPQERLGDCLDALKAQLLTMKFTLTVLSVKPNEINFESFNWVDKPIPHSDKTAEILIKSN